ncbi:MAG: hypothetical protein ACNA7J_04200 [Wenzhouxiangella sp.]
MLALRMISLSLAVALASAAAVAQSADDLALWRPDPPEQTPPSLFLGDRDASGLPGLRPRLTMRVPLGQAGEPGDTTSEPGAFSWSLEAWQLNTASLAHIQCNQHTLTIDTFVAEDCRFVDEPTPQNAVNLVQVRGEWMAAPGLSFGMGAFHSQQTGARNSLMSQGAGPRSWQQPLSAMNPFETDNLSDGLDLNVSFGISTGRVGDFLVGLQVARYRQRVSMTELGLLSDPMADFGHANHYTNSAQLSLGWRRGSFGGDLLGQHREAPLWLAGGTGVAPLNSFDLEFSWRPRNASLSVGISNVLDNTPRVDEPDVGLDDPLENVFGRIPYVRYKHDL